MSLLLHRLLEVPNLADEATGKAPACTAMSFSLSEVSAISFRWAPSNQVVLSSLRAGLVVGPLHWKRLSDGTAIPTEVWPPRPVREVRHPKLLLLLL